MYPSGLLAKFHQSFLSPILVRNLGFRFYWYLLYLIFNSTLQNSWKKKSAGWQNLVNFGVDVKCFVSPLSVCLFTYSLSAHESAAFEKGIYVFCEVRSNHHSGKCGSDNGIPLHFNVPRSLPVVGSSFKLLAIAAIGINFFESRQTF